MPLWSNELTAEQRLSKALIAIMERAPAIGGVAMVGTRVVDEDTPTACTDGRDEWYGRAFVAKQSDPQLRYLVIHEVFHKMYRHPITWRDLSKKCPQIANEACDYHINLKITDEFGSGGFAIMPDGGLYDVRFRGMNVKQIFDILWQENGDQPRSKQGGSGEGGDGDGDIDWEKAKELTKAEEAELDREIDEAIRQGDIVAGKMKGNKKLNVDDLLKPKVNWRDPLREFCVDTCRGASYSSYRRPNRRYLQQGVYMPSGVTDMVGELVFAADTSSSIFGRPLAMVLTEMQSICTMVNPSRVRILYWDTEVCKEEIYMPEDYDQLSKSTKPKGGGGTDVRCVPAYLRANNINAQAVIVLTDGDLWGGWGEWTWPLLWCILDNPSKMPPVGKVIHTNTGDM